MTLPSEDLCPDCGEPYDLCQCQWEDDDPENRFCWQCDGDGWVIVGDRYESDDYINGPYDGDIIKCPCCGGSGKAKDCTYW